MKSREQVEELTKSLNAPIPIQCQSVKGSIRYMVHKGNPEKYQYNWNDIKCHGGADLDTLCMATHAERLKIQIEIINFINDNNITEFCDLLKIAVDGELNDWVNVLMNFSTLSIGTYITSRRNKILGSIRDLTQ